MQKIESVKRKNWPNVQSVVLFDDRSVYVLFLFRLINTTIILFCLLLALGYSNGAPKPQSSSSEDEKIVFVAQPTEDQSKNSI